MQILYCYFLGYILSFNFWEVNSNFRPWLYTSSCVSLRVLWRLYYAVKYSISLFMDCIRNSEVWRTTIHFCCSWTWNIHVPLIVNTGYFVDGIMGKGNRKICECLLISIFKRDATSALDLHSRSLTIWSKIKIWDPTCCKLLMHFFFFY